MAISVCQAYAQGTNQNSDTLTELLEGVSAALPALPIYFSVLPLGGFLLVYVLSRLLEEALGIILCPE